MAIYIDGRVIKSGKSAGFVNLQDPRDLAKLVADANAASPEYVTFGGDLLEDTTINTQTFTYVIEGNGDVILNTIDPVDNTINNSVTTTTTNTEVSSADGTNSLSSSVKTFINGSAVMEATDGIITSGVAVTNAYAQLGTNDGTISSNILAEVSSGIAMTYDDGSNVAALAIVPDAGNALPGIKALGLPAYANEAAAIVGGLTTGVFYQTATGEVRVKL
jgi:hypothetical protein